MISTGKGEASKVYRTSDGCKTWNVVFENPESTSSFVSLKRVTGKQVYLLAQPVAGKFILYFSQDGGEKWFVVDDAGLDASDGELASGPLLAWVPFLYFGTQSAAGPRLHFSEAKCPADAHTDSCPVAWSASTLPGAATKVGAVAFRLSTDQRGRSVLTVVASTGGASEGSAAVSTDGGHTWTPASVPAGMHSLAAGFVVSKQSWIAVGPEGTVVSSARGDHWTRGPEAGSPLDTGWPCHFPML